MQEPRDEPVSSHTVLQISLAFSVMDQLLFA